MQITTTIVRVFTVVALVAAVGAGTARASSSQPAAMTAAEYEARMARSEASTSVGTGAAGVLGLALLAGGLVAAGRHGRRARAHA